jgi:effector-binding domain-containing protein
MPSYVVEVERRASVPLAVIRRQVQTAELSRVVPECCGLVWTEMRLQQAAAGRHVALYWDTSIRLEVGVELFGPFVERRDIVRSATPDGDVAFVVHFGPYDGLGAAHQALREWCEAHHWRPAGPNWEIYGHWQADWNANPSLIRTDICYQVLSTHA